MVKTNPQIHKSCESGVRTAIASNPLYPHAWEAGGSEPLPPMGRPGWTSGLLASPQSSPWLLQPFGEGTSRCKINVLLLCLSNKQILILNRQKQKRDSQAGQAGEPGLPSRVCIVPCGSILRLFTALHDNSSIQFQQKEAEAEKHV